MTKAKSKKIIIISAAVLCAVIAITAFFIYRATKEKGIVLYAPQGVKVALYKDKTVVRETKAETKDGVTYHYYIDIKPDETSYSFKSSANGYYSLTKYINLTKDKVNDLVKIDANPQKSGGNGYEPTALSNHTDETQNNIIKIDKNWKNTYKDVYSTPTLSSDKKAANEFTTQEEMEEFISKLDDDKDNLYRFSAGKTPTNNFDIPVLVFSKTDLSAAQTYIEAAEKIKAQDKPVIMYTAQIHGNEPAGGEGALAVAKSLDGEYGEKVLEKVNIVVLPRVNPDGSKAFTRSNTAEKIDLNRDHIKVKSKEIAAVHEVFNTFDPDTLIDGHEYSNGLTANNKKLRDVLIAAGGGVNTGSEYINTATAISDRIIKDLNEKKFTATYYPATQAAGAVKSAVMVNTANFSSGRAYYGLTGCLTYLVETCGIGIGKEGFERRVVAQYISVTSLIDYISEQPENIKTAIEIERANIIKDGETFDANSIFCLYSNSTMKENREVWDPDYNIFSGTFVNKDNKTKCYFYDKAERGRTKATAYVIPKNCEGADEVIRLANSHKIDYYELSSGETVMLKQYAGAAMLDPKKSIYKIENATLSDETGVNFAGGAYVFPCNQKTGLLLRYLFEPDVTDTESFGSGLCQSGTLKPENIYRSEQNLAAGKIK